MEKTKKNFLFDLDDTLIPTQHKYDASSDKIYNYIIDFFNGEISDKKQIKTDMNEAQFRVIAKIGLTRTNYIMAAEDVFMQYCERFGRKATSKEINDIMYAANTCFDGDAELLDGCVEVFESLKARGHDIYILTSGDVIIQKYKIFTSGLYKYFDDAHTIIVPVKNSVVFYENFRGLGLKNCVMVGNSLASDIKPALDVGMYAIHVPASTWAFDKADVNECPSLYTAKSIIDVIDISDTIVKHASSVA